MSERSGRGAGMHETTVRDHPPTGEDGLVFEHGAPLFAPRLTLRQKAQRGASALLAVMMTAFLLLGGPNSAVALYHTLVHTVVRAGPDARTLQLPALRDVPLPPGITALSPLRLSLSGDDSAAVYACWTEPDPASVRVAATGGRVHLAVLSPAASAWTELAPPLDHARQCSVTADPTVTSRLLLSLYGVGVAPGGIDQSGDCAAPALFYSPNAGQGWVSVSWPQTHLIACTVRASLIEGRIYVHADNPLLPAGQIPPGAHARIIRSDDLGATWRAADTGLPDVDAFGIVGLRPRGRLLAETFDNRNPSNATLWESMSAGAFWSSLGPLPGAFPQVYVADDPAQVANGGWGRLYLSARASDASPGSLGAADAPGSSLVAASWPYTDWTMLPAPPPSASAQAAVGAVGPLDSLLLLRAAIVGGAPAFVPPLDIWLWSPARASWREARFHLPAGALLQGTSWSGGTLRLWFLRGGPRPGTPSTPDLLALDVPPASVA